MRTRRDGSSGMVVPVALFVVLMLFSLVTAMHLLVRHNFQTTRWGHAKTQARFLAKAAVNRMLDKLNANAGGSFENEHKSEQTAVIEQAPGGTLREWVTDTNQANVILVMGRGTVDGGISETSGQTVLKKPLTNGTVFVRPWGATVGAGRACTLFSISEDRLKSGNATQDDWTMVPAVPNELTDAAGKPYDNRRTEGEKADYANQVGSITADYQGNLFAVRRRAGALNDHVLKYSTESQKWTPLPDVPPVYYTGKGEKVDDKVNIHPRLSDLASDGENRLFARWSRAGIDTVYALDMKDGGAQWQVLPPVPRYSVDSNGNPQERSRVDFVGNLRDYTADPSGTLYARWPREGVDTVYACTPSSDGKYTEWSALPPAPRAYYQRRRNPESGEMEVQLIEKDPKVAYNLTGLSVDRNGLVSAIFNRAGIDTVYQYDPSKKAWNVLPCVPRDFVKNAEDAVVVEDEDAGSTNLKQMATDSNNNVYATWRRYGVDTIFRYDSEARKYSMLPTIPRKYWKNKKADNGDPVVEDLSNRHDNSGVMQNVMEIAGGGKNTGSQFRYVEVNDF